ncbi:putative transcription factor C2H2 family [Helianthus annuus]|nr:putative transcription factor C2H2 family [Helianthus annuus]
MAYSNQHSFDYVPPEIREHRRDRITLNQLENKGVVKPVDPYMCRVCGRKFYTNEKLINHFKQIHEREHQKRVSRIESAKVSQRVKIVGKYSMKMEKHNNVARDILTPKVGYGLGDELKPAGYG